MENKDKSPKGSYDKEIIPLINLINSFPEYATTSSCSGRIVLLSNLNKKQNKWLYKTHSKANSIKIHSIIQKQKAWFLQEPFILHVKCTNPQSTSNLLKLAQAAGFKHSGITQENFIEIRGNERIETILHKNSKEYIQLLTEEANKKLSKTKTKIKNFYNLIKEKRN